MTIAAFGIVGAGPRPGNQSRGDPTHRSGPGLGRRHPLTAAIFAFLLLAFAGIPLTSGFTSKFAVFEPALRSGGARHRHGRSSALLCSAITVFVYVRVIVLMYFSDAQGDTVGVVTPSALTPGRHRHRSAAHSGARRRCRRHCCSSRITRPSSCDDLGPPAMMGRMNGAHHPSSPSRASRPSWRRGSRTGWPAWTTSSWRRVDHDDPLVAQASAHLAEAGGKRFRPLLTLLASELGTGCRRGRGGRRRASS